VTNPTLIAKTISDFDSHCFDSGDKFRYAVIVPEPTLSALENTAEYEYVRVAPQGEDGEGTLAQIVSFSDSHDAAVYSSDDGVSYACIRTELQREIGLEPDTERNDDNMYVTLRECDTTTLDGLGVHRVSAWEQQERDITTEGLAGYITADDMDSVDELQSGNPCEIVNPETGSRIQLPIRTYNHKSRKRNTIRLDGITRNLLRIQSKDEGNGDGDSVRLRVLDDAETESRITERLSDWIGRRFVDYSVSNFRVLPGYDRDEGRNVIRMNRDAMKGLGIDENDRVLLSWFDSEQKRRTVRCQSGWKEDTELEPETTSESSYGEDESLSVRVPSTERDELNISIGDSIRIRRDMRYQAGKQVSLSAFGILGVIVGTNQLINMLFDELDALYVLISVLSVVVLSIVTVWLIMSPVRQKCRTPG